VALYIDKTLHGLEDSSGKENIVAMKMKRPNLIRSLIAPPFSEMLCIKFNISEKGE
jgi:hypothetical protein